MKNKLKQMFAAAKKSNVLELFVYNRIGEDWYGDGVTPQSVQDAIKAAGDIESITVHINSPGGSSFDGVAIHNILRQQGVPVNVVVEGLAASAAFTVAMAGDTIGICDGAMMMLHNAWSFAMGEAKDMRKMADLLDTVSGTMRDVYAKRSGLSADAVKALMDEETWLTPEQAVEKGFATEKVSTTPEKSEEAKSLAASFNLSMYSHKVPDNLKTAAGKKSPKASSCECDCEECMEGECQDCTHAECDCAGCDCPTTQSAAKKAEEAAAAAESEANAVRNANARSRHIRIIEKKKPA